MPLLIEVKTVVPKAALLSVVYETFSLKNIVSIHNLLLLVQMNQRDTPP